MQTSANGLALIERSEGLRTSVYADAVGVLTVGWGHVIRPGDGLGPASSITLEQAEAFLQSDVHAVEEVLNTLIPDDCTQNQYDACVDFGFNLGVGALRTMLGHGWQEVPTQMLRWTDAGNKKDLPGLVTRRKAEVALFTQA